LERRKHNAEIAVIQFSQNALIINNHVRVFFLSNFLDSPPSLYVNAEFSFFLRAQSQPHSQRFRALTESNPMKTPDGESPGLRIGDPQTQCNSSFEAKKMCPVETPEGS